MTDTNEKLRSLFLVALMVFSVFAGTVALSGSAAAVSNLNAGTFYSGQDVQFTANNADTDYQVRTVDESGDEDQVGSLRRTIESDENGLLEFTLDNRLSEGDFVIVNANTNEVINLNTGDEDTVANTGLTAAETFEVIPQDLTAEFDDDEVGTSGDAAEVDYEITSDVRNGYAVNISAEGLDREELLDILDDTNRNAVLPDDAEIVSEDNPGDIVDADGENFFDDTEKVQIKQAEGDYTLDFTDINEGNYTFEVEVTDTDANASDTIDVTDTGDASASFQEGVVTENRGDVANITVQLDNTDEATIQIGDVEDDNYYISAEVTDDDDDGEVSVLFNSWRAGTDDADEVLTVAGDDEIDTATVEQGGSFTDTSQASGSDILEATDYDMLVVEGHSVSLPNNDDLTDYDGIDGGEQIITDEDDVGTLSLEEASLENLQTWTAPQEKFSDIEDLDDDETAPVYELVKDGNITQTDEIAINDVNDVVIVQVEASGFEGAFTEGGDLSTGDYGALSQPADDNNANSGPFALTFENADPGANVDSPQQDIDQLSGYKVIYDEANDTHFVAIESSEFVDELGAEDEDEYVANFTVFNNGYGDANDPDGNGVDYLGASDLIDADDDSENVTDSVQFIDADATLNNDDDLVVRASENQQIRGTTNVAPGSEVTVRVRSSESSSPFLLQPSAIVGPNGTFTAMADFSERSPGANFTAQTRVGSAEVGDEVDGTIAGAATASVSISDQDSDGTTVVVDSAQLSDGGFIAIHEGSASGDVIGASDYLAPGSHSDIEVTLDTPQDGDFTAVAMPHLDDDGDETYDFPDNDGPYTDNGTAVTDSAEVTIAEDTPTETETETEAPDTETETETEAPDTDTETEMPDTETTTGDSGPGFTAAIALIALVAAALLAVRRNN